MTLYDRNELQIQCNKIICVHVSLVPRSSPHVQKKSVIYIFCACGEGLGTRLCVHVVTTYKPAY